MVEKRRIARPDRDNILGSGNESDAARDSRFGDCALSTECPDGP
jgi:hypothetical protein